jgi:hypothetical protein
MLLLALKYPAGTSLALEHIQASRGSKNVQRSKSLRYLALLLLQQRP